MNWSNGFSTTLTLRCKALGWRRCELIRRAPGGAWRLLGSDGAWCRAELRAAWLAGSAAGLRFRTFDGGRYDVLVLASRQGAADWRRLRVHLKLPRP